MAAARDSAALQAAWRVAWTTRLGVLLVAVFAALTLGPASGGLARENELKFDSPGLTHALAEPVLSPLARWDAVWYLRIADSGYTGSEPRAAFFPLYPLLIRALAAPAGGSPAALLAAAYLIALAPSWPRSRSCTGWWSSSSAAGWLGRRSSFWRCSRRRCSSARPTRRASSCSARWARSTPPGPAASIGPRGAALGAATTRSAGLLLLVPLAMLWWSSRERRPADAAWLLLAPLGVVAYAAWLGLTEGDALRFLDVQGAWSRELVVPLTGAWDGFGAALDGARQLASGSRTPVYFEIAAGDPYRIAAINIMLFAFLVFALVSCVGVLRRLPRAYGVWVAASLVLPLSFPVTPQPLMSLPRFVAVLFPIFMWLALVCDERRNTDLVAGASAVGLGVFTAQFAGWHWIS